LTFGPFSLMGVSEAGCPFFFLAQRLEYVQPQRILLAEPMKKRLGTGFLLLLGFSAAASDWKLVWSDEFDKPGLPDPAKWSCETGFIRNNEEQYYTRDRLENARVENGMLVIEARKERFKNP